MGLIDVYNNMKNYLLMILGVVIVGLSSCSKKADDVVIPPFDSVAQAKADSVTIQAYLTAHPEITATKGPKGLYYQITTAGTGAHPTENSIVSVDYVGTLPKGTVFDSGSYTTPLNFRANIIEGWKLGIPLMRKGGKMILILPSALAYGNSSPSPSVGANAVMIFNITLKDFQ
ncbi:peptidylprolyl isomerase [Inquilinus sp. KBS0705]|nr:peptidylprolyl isomerase [Inquilinus sp. KBS0705]